MLKTNKKFSIVAIIAAISFIYLAFCPYILNPIYNIILGQPFNTIIKNLLSTIFNLGNIVNFIANIILAVGILTKFDKIAVAASSALFWLVGIIDIITGIINSIKFEYYQANIIGMLYSLAYMFAYFLMFVIALWLAFSFFKNKPAPKFLKFVVFVPIVIFAIITLFSSVSSFINVITTLTRGTAAKWLLYSVTSNSMNIFGNIVFLIGFAAVAVKLADLKKKPNNTMEISENVVIENIVSE